MHELSNNEMNLRIDPVGAEMKSLEFRGKEYLWPGSADSWKGSSPQLFPVVGLTPPGGWEWKGRTILMGNHGFARGSRFSPEEGPERAVFTLTESEETLKQYPFPFRLAIGYALEGPRLTVSYEVENPGAEDLLFSLGAHPGFLCPLEEGLAFSDYYLQFNRRENSQRRLKEDFLTGREEPLFENTDRLDLNYPLFERGALIFSDLRSDRVVLKSDKSERSVCMDFEGFPHFGIWTIPGKEAPYLCLEPWCGIDSTLGDPKAFEAKEGLIRLAPGERFRRAYALSFT